MATVIDRIGAAGDIPQQIAQAILGEVRTESTVMSLGRQVPVSTRDSSVPVLTSVPDASWLTGETGAPARKAVTAATWESVTLTAEELAAIVIIPDSVLEDSEWDIWAAVRPLISRAFARRVDMAVMFGAGAPASFGAGMVAAATTATQVVTPSADSAADLLEAAEQVSVTEHAPTAAVVRPGWQYAASRERTQSLTANPVGSTYPLSVAGLPIRVDPTYWDAAVATAIVADWQSVLYGIRHDLSFEMFNSGIVQNPDGTIATNLLQEDCTAMRCVLRIGHVLAEPVNSAGVADVPVATIGPAA
ncbi:phage major capsid protein [Actinomycetospora lutea]|uniref:phage major capsid protein n=1 Tax=Actinomycetospora lutea TaxID=663604 RepID=UPI002365F0A9|nr:phage major capsid protein [Actinomycetospora lutea]MDD7940453.1 phage major capsid protein [Actinomycetospora lutea]